MEPLFGAGRTVFLEPHMSRYQPGSIEPKWQSYWEEKGTFVTPQDFSKPKYYVLSMFPYPSGSGLHVGHPVSYTAVDIVARYKRMKGHNVLNPMGWDAFGLPAERHAVRTGEHPSIITKKNVDKGDGSFVQKEECKENQTVIKRTQTNQNTEAKHTF